MGRIKQVVKRNYEEEVVTVDGARLAYGLTAEGADLTLPDLAQLCDILCVGGTKCGALFGEEVMIFSSQWKGDFRYMIKQRGGMLAKGRLLGLQFLTLFTEGVQPILGGGAGGGRIGSGHKVTFILSRMVKQKISAAQGQASTSWKGRGTCATSLFFAVSP